MKKILSLILCSFILLSTMGAMAADDTFKIVSGSISDGDIDAPVSVLLRYEFSEDIKEPALEDVTILPATVSELSAEGNTLNIRLAAKMSYNTEHILDLSKITSVSGKKLAESESKIKFETKFGEALKIFEDDFETGELDKSFWRSSTDTPLQLEGDGGNYCRKATSGTTFDNFTGGSSVYKLDGDFLIEFDILIDKETIEIDYATLNIFGNNGLSSTDENFKRFETKRLLGYDVETGKFGVLFNTLNSSASIPAAPIAGKVLFDGWNNILLKINTSEQTLNLYINGDLVEDSDGGSDFLIPCEKGAGYSATFDNMPISNILHRSVSATTNNGGANACIYYDNISYREVTAPIFANSSIKEGEKISATRPEIKLYFKNFPSGAQLSLNGTPVAESDIRKISSNVLSIYPALSWEESYTLSGKVLGEFGSEKEFVLSFETGAQPTALIETVGFFSGERRLFVLESGNISTKVNFWQSTPQSYILIVACYKEIDGRVKMLSISSPIAFTSENLLEEKEVFVTVPEDSENCFIEYIVLKDSLSKMPYEPSLYSGSQQLK